MMECEVCGGQDFEEVTTVPLNRSGRCEVYLICLDCGHENLVGHDSVL